MGIFDAQTLQGKSLFFFCNVTCLQYKLEDGEVWPENQSLNYNAILQLDLFCQNQGKWAEIPYMQVFMALRNNLKNVQKL